MSGIVGIVVVEDGTPVDERLLRRMTHSMAYRGPDRQDVWRDGPVGFGHTLLRTTTDFDDEAQPATLDGRVWITADARVDGRAALVRELEAHGCRGLGDASDSQLILHAYVAWGTHCVEHLLGDFAFAIWDARARRLFCARDHFGIKPFYYAQVPGGFVFSNTLECIRQHPGVGDALNDAAIADFLRFGSNQDPTTTTFSNIHRLAPAHSLTWEEGTLHVRRYWALPTDGRIRYRRSREYVDHFEEILRVAVADRLRVSDVGVWMSGGLDSTSIAATARQLLSERGGNFNLRAHTIVYDTLIPDEERHYAGLAAEALGVETSYFAADGYKPFVGWDRPEVWTPEPTDDPFFLMRTQQLKQVASHSRVLLCGEGGDEVLWSSYVVDLFGRMPWLELGADITRTLVRHRRRPAAGIRARLRQLQRDEGAAPEPPADHPLRPEAHRRLATAPWSWYFESFDPGVMRVPVEGRYPFLDLRLVNYLLAIPPLPWCIDKEILRETMRGTLPDAIRLRRKAPLAGDPLHAHLGGREGKNIWRDVRPLCLNHWLRRVHTHAS
jgi:asparagine synthase (glutamine-hydrolysing)